MILRVRQTLAIVPTVGTIQEPGPTGLRVAANVKALREARGISVRGLAARMAELGRPLLPSGVGKIEQGQRRVDADELVALALALDVAPNRLLLPAGAGTADGVELTPEVTIATEDAAWRWACGEYQPFPLDAPTPVADVVRFMAASRPHAAGNLVTLEADIAEHREALAPIARAVRDAEKAGVSLRLVIDYLRLSDALDREEIEHA